MFHIPDVLVASSLVYTFVYTGCLDNSKFDARIGGDNSFGIYLYGDPLTQMVVYYLKDWLGSLPAALQLVTVAAIALPLTCLIAFLSWDLNECRCLELKRFYIQRKAVAPVAVAPGCERPSEP